MKRKMLSILLCASLLGGVMPFAFSHNSAAAATVSGSFANDIYEPQTAISQAPIVMQNAKFGIADITNQTKRPSALIFDVCLSNGVLTAYDGDTSLGSFEELYRTNYSKTNVGARIALGDLETAKALAEYVIKSKSDNLWLISPDVTVLNTVTKSAPLVRGVIDFTQDVLHAPADVDWNINTADYAKEYSQSYVMRYFTSGIAQLTREQIYDIFYSSGSGYTTALIPIEQASTSLLTMLSAMGIFTVVETGAETKTDFYNAILTGANGILSSNYAVNIDTLEDKTLFPSEKDTQVLVRPSALVAHRGDNMGSSYWKENSVPAFISAAESSATLIEFDVYMTVDKKLILMHDEKTGTKYIYRDDCPLDAETQAANSAKKVSERYWKGDLEYVIWKATSNTGPINQLHELLDVVDTEYPDAYLFLEMKTGYTKNLDGSLTDASYEPYNRVMELLCRYGVRSRTTLISFSTITTEYGHKMGFAAKQLNTYAIKPGNDDIKTIMTRLENQRSNIFEQSITDYKNDTTKLQSRLRHYGFITIVGGVANYKDLATVIADGINRITSETVHRADKEVLRLIADYDPNTGKVSATYEHYRHKTLGLFDETSKTDEVFDYWIQHGYAAKTTTSKINDSDFEIITIAGNPTVNQTSKTATGKSGDVIALRYKKQAIRSDCTEYYYTYSPAIYLGTAADKSSLQTAILSAGELAKKQDNYTGFSWKLMSDALVEAKTVFASTKSTQGEVDAVTTNLCRRINELEYKNGTENNNSTVSVTIPVTTAVVKSGETLPPKKSFTLVIDGIDLQVAPDVVYTGVTDTSGEGNYDSSLVITAPKLQLLDCLYRGISVSQKNDGDNKWKYDTAVYRVRGSADEKITLNISRVNSDASSSESIDRFYFKNTYTDGAVQTGWALNDGEWYYFDTDGVMETGWLCLGGVWYYLDADGKMLTNWQCISGHWYYFNPGGSMAANTWVGNFWLDALGKMAVNSWVYYNDAYYYVGADGAYQTGWICPNGTSWYCLDIGGRMMTGWQYIGGAYYYLTSGGSMAANTWVGNFWLDASGKMAVNTWVYYNGAYYYVGADGAYQTGWIYVGGAYYYLNAGGVMQTGWQYISGNWYYFYSGGSMATNCYIGNNRITASGAMA